MRDIKEIHMDLLGMLVELDKIARDHGLNYCLAYGTVLGAVRHNGFIPWDTDVDIIVEMDQYQNFCDTIRRYLPSEYVVKHIKYDKEYDSLKARVCLQEQPNGKTHLDIFPMVGAPNSKIPKWIFSKVAYINYKCYFIKKVNANLTFNERKKRRRVVKFLKVCLGPFPENYFIGVNNILGRMFPFSKSTYVYNLCGSYGMKEFIPREWLGDQQGMEFEEHIFPVPKEWDRYLTHIYGDYFTPKKTNYV